MARRRQAFDVDDVLEPVRDPVQRATPIARLNFGFGLPGLLQGQFRCVEQERVEPGVVRVDEFQQFPRVFNG